MTPVIVGTDGSEGAAMALRWAVREGALRDLPVTAVLTWSYVDQHHPDGGVEFEPQYDRADAAAALDAFVERALGSDAARTVGRSVVCDRPAPGLLTASEGSPLLVLGARGLGGFRGLLIGSVSQQCLQHTSVPVAIVRDDPAPAGPGGGIVVGVDGSDTARTALAWALDEARARRCRLTVVHAWVLPQFYGYPFAVPIDPAPFEDAARSLLEGTLAAADTADLPHPVETVLSAGGSPAEVLLTAAEGAELVVVGTRGVGGFRGMLLGSVSTHVTQHARCPVVVIPTGP